MTRGVILALLPLAAQAAGSTAATSFTSKCRDIKTVYQSESCCGNPDQSTNFQVVPFTRDGLYGSNPCEGAKPTSDPYWDNVNCTAEDGLRNALEQAGVNVTLGYVGGLNSSGRVPITTSYLEAGLCPVNVHWHLGTEHYSLGEYDEMGMGPYGAIGEIDMGPSGGSYRRLNSKPKPRNGDQPNQRRLASPLRRGYRCHYYDSSDSIFTTEYTWQHCVNMTVGETYEVHWPHSAAGACGTPNQYQYPFYDGVFCMPNILSLDPLNTYIKIGVQSQIFTIVNDESYYYPDLMRGMIIDGEYGADMAKYTGSTTGTTRDNEICSRYTPITWQVDRQCHLISASSFDKMCADMKTQRDDMSGDLVPHGARELVDDFMAANAHYRRQ